MHARVGVGGTGRGLEIEVTERESRYKEEGGRRGTEERKTEQKSRDPDKA